jgi:broad specificity phosphatase PhoE
VATFAASAERKAIETLRAAVHADFTTDERFGEVRRPNEPISDDVRPARRAWVAGALDRRHEGWESPRAAADRFGAGLDALPGEAVVVATHGMVLTSWLVTVGVVRPGEEAAEFWSGLVLPDVIRVQLP